MILGGALIAHGMEYVCHSPIFEIDVRRMPK
jgi:hypothetical protein